MPINIDQLKAMAAAGATADVIVASVEATIKADAEKRKPRQASLLPREPKRGKSLMRSDWKPSDNNLKDARALGLSDREIARAADEFRDYWLSCGRAMVDWDATWRNRCRAIAEKLGRAPRPKNGHANGFDPRALSRDDWKKELHLRHFNPRSLSVSGWNPAYGPEPGQPGCLVPAELLR